jgi:enoyl-CoA hydratase/carnithine racemase
MNNEILYDKNNSIAYITLNRAEKYNTFNEPFAKLLNDYLILAERDDEVEIVVIKSMGKNFSTGIDLSELNNKSGEDLRSFIKLMDLHNHTILNMTKIVVTEVKGYTLANGAGLAFASDFTIAADNTLIGTTAINVGLLCLGPLVPLMKLVNKKTALDMILTGKMLNAHECLELGIVNMVVPLENLEAEGEKFVLQLLSKNREAIRLGKHAVNSLINMPIDRSIDYMSELFFSLAMSTSSKEYVNKFLNRKKKGKNS